MDIAAFSEKRGRFGHHPDPAIDFCIETEIIGNEWLNTKMGFMVGTPPRSEIEERVSKAMEFRVGGDLNAIEAKAALRIVEREMREGSPRALLQ